MSLHVAVLMGGWSAEREVSLTSGRAAAEACRRIGYRVTEIDMGRDIAERLRVVAPDVVFNALHGTPGEDGSVQGMMDLMGLRYTHSGVIASAVAIDKELTKRIMRDAGIRVPEGREVKPAELNAGDPVPRPYVLKPVTEGSSVGIAIVDEGYNLDPADWTRFARLMAEEFIPGRELTVAVLGDEALGVTELRPKRGFYDYEAKYTDGITVHELPAKVPDDVAEAAMSAALQAHRLLGCRGCSRSDFRYDEERGADGLYFLEVNTQPGLTPLSLVPEQAAWRGISFDALVKQLVEAAF